MNMTTADLIVLLFFTLFVCTNVTFLIFDVPIIVRKKDKEANNESDRLD